MARTDVGMFRFELSQGELERTPSREAGVTEEEERAQRALCAELVFETCRLLDLAVQCAARGIVLVQRLYFRTSLTELSVLDAVPAVVFLAAKLEEDDKRLRFVISTYQRVLLRRAGHREDAVNLPIIEFTSDAYFEVRVCFTAFRCVSQHLFYRKR